MRNRKFVAVLTALVLAVFVGACTLPSAPSPVININNNLVNTVTFANPVPSVDSGCAAIGSIQINRPETLAVGGVGQLSITPLDSAGNKRTPQCDIKDGVHSSAQPSNILSIEDPHAFVTTLKGLVPGETTLSIGVGNANASVRIVVK